MPEKYICLEPFRWFEVNSFGEVFLCCPSWLPKPIGNLKKNSVKKIWNGKSARDIRKSMFDGSFRYCNKETCPRLLKKEYSIIRLKNASREIQSIKKTGKLDYGPKYLNLCYDRSCNLACPSCRNHFYTAKGEKDSIYLGEKLKRETCKSVEYIKVSGTGDPFGSCIYRKMLQEFNPEDYPNLREIALHTNAQLWDKKMWESMKNIHPFVRLALISVDASKEKTYRKNRGSSFRKLLKNFKYIKTLPITVILTFVVQKNNYAEMPSFVKLARRFNFEVIFSQLMNWGTFKDSEFKKRAVHIKTHPEHEKFRKILKRISKEPQVSISNLSYLLKDNPKD